jgi:hypothetical protein
MSHSHPLPIALTSLIAALVLTGGDSRPVVGQEGDADAARQQAIQQGLEFLRTTGQAEDGTFSAQAGPGLTALVLTAALRNGATIDDPMIAKGLAALEGFVKPDGGIYGNGRLRNYETCVAIMCFAEANKDGRYKELLDNAEKFVRGLQIGADGSIDAASPTYGGVGYGGPDRPDLSNTSYLIDALAAAGAEDNDEAIQRAVAFVTRCQNLAGAGNDTPFADKVNDGGFYYVIPTESVDPSDSERYTASGGIRSYGSMSYAGFKTLVYAGLTKEDPRVGAVLDWVSKNYSVEENPGVGSAGLFYYYHSFASALAASGLSEVADAAGAKHDWRAELVAELVKRQNEDGSWTNSNRQWFENDPNLSTAFALLALDYCAEPTKSP